MISRQEHISIVIPVFNEESFIEDCLKALSKQSVTPDRIYVVDNNSSDRSIEIVKQFKQVTIINEPIQGICAATKKGLDSASAHEGIILRCDADCRPKIDWVQRTVNSFAKDPAMIALTGPGVAYDVPAAHSWLMTQLYMKPYFFLVGLALRGSPLFGSNFAVRSSAWRLIANDTHLLDLQNIHDDIDISIHLRAHGKVQYDKTLLMPISARPFTSIHSLAKRYAAGFRSIFIHWPQHAPWNLPK